MAHGRRIRWRGAALVEFALIAPLLILFLLGIIEFGLLMMHQMALEQAAREGSRIAAVRGTTDTTTTRITNAAVALPNEEEIQVTLAYSTDNGQTFPYALGDMGSENNAPPGSLIQVSLDCPHHLVMGSFFAWLPGVENNAVPLHADVMMRRE